MATLRERLTPQEQQRFKQLYNQGYFNQITLERFTQRLGQELQYIDMLQQRSDRATADLKRVTGSAARDVQRRSELQYTIDYAKERIPKLRAGVFDSAISGDLGGRTRRAIQDFERATMVGDDGQLVPEGAVPFFKDDAEKNLMDVAWDKYWQDQGLIRGTLDVAGSMVTGPIRGAQQLSTGSLGENPLEAVAEIGSILPIGRAAGRLLARPGSLASRAVRSPLWTIPSYTAQVSDIVGAGEDAYLELLAEAGFEAIGSGGDLVRHLRNTRGGRIFQGLDPQAAEDAQSTDSTAEHDTLTGSRTAPQQPTTTPRGRDYAPQANAIVDNLIAIDEASQAEQDALEPSARAQLNKMRVDSIEAEAMRRRVAQQEALDAQAEQDAQALAYSRAQMAQGQQAQAAEAEAEALTAQQATIQQQASEMAAEASAEQQTAEAEKIEHTKSWLPFYSDLAGGSQSEGIRLLNQEYEAGVRDPIAHRYDTIAAGLREQMGAVPSELHRETDARLRRMIGEKWYNTYRGIDQRPTPQERAQRASEAADAIVDGGDTDGTDGTGEAEVSQEDNQTPTQETTENIPEVSEQQAGDTDFGFWSDKDPEKPIQVRPVARELDDVTPSHDTQGNEREDYPEGLQPRQQRSGPVALQKIREDAARFNPYTAIEFTRNFAEGPPLTSKQHPRATIAGTGRHLMLQIVRAEHPEKWAAYQQLLREMAAGLGIDPVVLDTMDSPILTYELLDDLDEVELAKDTNEDAMLSHSSVEDAAFDASLLEGDILFYWKETGETNFLKALESPENADFRNRIISKIPKSRQPEFLTSDNTSLSATGQKRLMNAMIRYVFSDTLGETYAKRIIDRGLEGNVTLDAMLRNSMPWIAQMKASGIDISEVLVQAVDKFIQFDETAEKEAGSEENKNRETGPLTKEELLWRGIQTSFQSGSLFEPTSTLENQLLYLIYAKKKGSGYTDGILAFQDLSTSAIQARRSEPDTDPVSDYVEKILNRIIVDYVHSEAFIRQAEQESIDVLIAKMPPEIRGIRRAYENAEGADTRIAAAQTETAKLLQLINGPQAEVDPNAATETETETTDRGMDAGGQGTPRGTEQETRRGTPDLGGDTRTPETPESASGVAGDQPRGTQSDEPGGTQGAADNIQPDDPGSDLADEQVLAAWIERELDPDSYPGITARQKFIVAVVHHLRNTDAPLTEAQLIAGYAAAADLDPATLRAAAGHITDMHKYVDEAIEETLGKRDVQEKGITRAMLENRLPTQTQESSQQEPSLPTADSQQPIDTNQVVGVSRRIETQDTPPDVDPNIAAALEILDISAEEWERHKAEGTAEDFLNSLPQDTDYQIDAVVDLYGDIAGDADFEMDEDWDIDDDDFFEDVETGRLRDITDEQRSDFDTVRRKLFLAKTIARLEAKGGDRTPVETAQLRALQATQRTDAQQELYERMLTAFIDAQVKRLQAKPKRSATENRILDALTAVQAEGLPEEASELSLYSDLETPDQEHSRPLAETRTLAGVQAPDTGDTQLDLPESVTADKTKLSPAQQSSVKAIVAAFLRKIHTSTDATVQGGFLLADKPGVGKTRQALATLWHYMRQGVEKHFVLAPNRQLLNNYTTDMRAMGGPASDISHYDSSNPQPNTPIGTTTYSMLTRKPDLVNFTTTAGTQNAIADIVAHLTGARPTLRQTHPEHYQATLDAYRRILGNVQNPTVENAVAELRRQAGIVNLDNPANVEQFRQRLTPLLADLLLAERTQEGQQQLFEGSELQERVRQLLSFGENILFRATQPDPDFQAKAEAFEGVIVLDEMHKAAGTASQTGRMIETLHQLLPNAKFLYMSATPFKEIGNFFVAERLGLWGANQPFQNFPQFRIAFRRAARAVKEVIPLHLKQIGRYISRALSAKETRYTPMEVPLTEVERQQYDTAVQFVQGIGQRFESAIDAAERTPWGSLIDNEGEFHQYRAKYMRMFYGEMQKVFLAVLDAMKAQGLQADLREKLQNGDKVIVQLENTWEATTKRAEARGQDTAGPFDLLIDFVSNENLFPVHEHQTEVHTRKDGSNYTVVVPRQVYNDEGQRVRSVDPRLKQLQTQLLNMLMSEMQRVESLPFAADIIHAIAAEAGVASGEISGRTDTDREALSTAFSETTDVNLIVLGPAGLTGINLPVRENIKDAVGGLYHYLVQSSWNVNTFEQGLGRGKRSDSAIDPHYIIAHQDMPGADRVLGATLAKFAEMGALAGQADNALMQNIDKVEGETSLDDDPDADADVFDDTQDTGERSHVFGVHGREALAQLWKDMYDAGEFEIADRLGLARPELAGGTGFVDPDTIPSVQQFFQRLLHQSTENQPQYYKQFEDRLKRIIAYRRELGELDVGANDLNSSDGQITDRLTIFTDPDTNQTAEMVRLSVKRKLPRRSWEFTQKVIRGEPGYEQHGRNFAGIYTDADGHVWAMFEAPYTKGQETEFIRWGPRGTPVQGLHQGEHRLTAEQLQSDFTQIDTEQARQDAWEAEDNSADTYVDSELFMATGLILPKWKDLSIPRTHALMAVIPMIDGSQLHGRVIPSTRVPEVLEQIGGVDPNHFSNQPSADSNQQETEASPFGEGSDIDIPAIVREIIGSETDTRIAARLERIAEHIHKKLPLRLRGHRVSNAAEAALLGQFIRDPQVEHVWIVYRKDDRILKIEPMSLNRKGEAQAGDFAHIKRETARLKADSILRIHNHPSGVARWSDADKRVAMQWHRELGTLMAEDIIVNSGTYAYRTFENGQYTWHGDTELDPSAVEWATGAFAREDVSGELKPTDVLYQNPLIRGAREAATYAWGLKHRTDAAELIFIDPKTGKISDTITDTKLRTSRNDAEIVATLKDLIAQRPGQHVHVVMWGGNPAFTTAKVLMKNDIEGLDSVWVDGVRGQGIEHIGQSTEETTDADDTVDDDITIRIGDEDHTLVRLPDDDSDTDTDTLSDVITDIVTDLKKWWNNLTKREKAQVRKKRKFTKPVMIAGIQHELLPDSDRILRNRFDRGVDAEHMAKGNERANLQSILKSGTLKKSGVYPGIDGVGPRVFFSYGPYYRRNEGRHNYGIILDLDKMLRELSGMHGTIHQRNNWGSRREITSVKEMRQLLRSNQIGHPDTVIEISFPQDIDINAYFVGVVMDSKVYAKKEHLVENQLTSERLPARATTSKSESALKQEIRDLKANIKSLITEMKPQFDRAIQEEEGRLRRTEDDIEARRKERNQLKNKILGKTTTTPYSDQGRIDTLEHFIEQGVREVGQIKGRIENLRKWESTLFFHAPNTADVLRETQKQLRQAARQLKELQNPRRKRQGIRLSDVTNDNILRDYTAQVQRTNPDSVVYRVHAPEQLSMEGRGRAKSAEIGEKALNTFIDSNAGIMKVLNAWSPTARRWARLTKNEFVSGFGKLTDLEAPEGSDAPAPADVLKEILRERQHISKLNAGRALSSLEPHLLAFNKLARKRVRLRTTAAAPGTRKAKRMELSHQVWNFVEYNTPIENDPDLLEVAESIKEAWRELLIYDTQKIVELMGELEKINEKLYVTDAQGKRIEWYGESFDGFEWDPENRRYTKKGKSYTIEEAHRAANKLYMPHYFRGKSPLQEYSALQKVLDDLNTLLATDNVAAEDLQRFGIEFDESTSTYTHTPTGNTAATPYEMVRIVANYLATEDAALQGIVNYYEDEGRVGYYGHLERTRETDDRFYIRDISLMAENRIRLWDRLAEVAVLGQQHPLLGDSPRMKTLIEQVMNFDKTPREAALRKFIEPLKPGEEGMFQRLPQFASGVDTALDIMQHWLERDADGQKTGRYQEIDIGRMNLDDATLAELERIGLIEKDGDGYKVVGDDIDERHATLARHIHEFYNTLAQRKHAVQSLVLGLGNWHTRDPLEMESAEFWKKINDAITVLTLNHGVAIQNMLEIPLISMMTGANPLFKGLKNMSNKEYRGAMQQLSRGLSHARKFMADTSLADKYLGSPLTFFSKSDEFSRAAGLGIGLENAKEKIQRYAEAEGKKKAAIGRDMDAVRLNKEVIDSIPEEELASVLEAAEQHILNNEVETVFSSEKGSDLSPAERLAGTMLRSMFYVSDETFKQYDASTLPQFMVSKNPLIRVFMKYKSWMLQQNRLVYNQLKRAYREAKKGNLRPLGDFIAASSMMGLGTGGLLWLYSGLQGDDEKTIGERLFKGLAAAQTFGIASVMFELAMYAEGNWYQMSNLLAKQAAGPTFSVAAQMIAPVFTGDFAKAGEEALRRVPIVSFSRRVGGWRLLEEATGGDTDAE